RLLIFIVPLLALFPGPALAKGDAYQEGVDAFDAGDYPQAESRLREAIVERPGSILAHAYLGKTLKRENNCPDAIAEFELARTINTTRRAGVSMDEVDAEELECKALLTEIPVSPAITAAAAGRVAFDEGVTAYQAHDYAGALALFTRAQETLPDDN